MAASYLAKARGSGEPERSSQLARDMENYVRDLKAFVLDHGHKLGDDLSDHVEEYRQQFEALLGHKRSQVSDRVQDRSERGSSWDPENGSLPRGNVTRGRTTRTQNGTARIGNGNARAAR